jgi:hypothetical protein
MMKGPAFAGPFISKISAADRDFAHPAVGHPADLLGPADRPGVAGSDYPDLDCSWTLSFAVDFHCVDQPGRALFSRVI